jgi:hypothetical protein
MNNRISFDSVPQQRGLAQDDPVAKLQGQL